MKTRTFTIVFLLLSLVTMNLFSAKVDEQTAKNIAKNYYWEASQGSVPLKYDQIQLSLFSAREENGNTLYYIFNINENDGFIIVSADDCALPVIGYSTEGQYTGIKVPEGLQSLLNAHARTLSEAIQLGETATPEVSEEWKKFAVYNPNPPAPKGVSALLTTVWDQGCAFNAMCPSFLSPYYWQACGRAWAGCGATAMAQLMKYYAFPSSGVGINTYQDTFPNNTNNVLTHTVNFGASTYQYANMPNTLNWWDSTQFHIARLTYHCGVAVDMDYDTVNSISYMDKILAGFKNHFRYSGGAYWDWMSEMTAWKNKLKNELNQSRPLFYFGSDVNDDGHFWVCDGYDNSDRFHMNWGVLDYNASGIPISYNGYFYLTNLVPKPGGLNFSWQQAAIFGLIPSNYCAAWSNSPDSLAIMSFQLNNINNQQSGLYSWKSYNNYESEYSTNLQRTVSYSVRINVRYLFVPLSASSSCWVDWNQDGDFIDNGEAFSLNHINDWVHIGPGPIKYYGIYEGKITVPAGAVLGQTVLRTRLINFPVSYPCSMSGFGEVEDYGLTITDGTLPPDPKYPFIFSLDIGSDTELSDPQADGDEIFDPGDCYYWDGTILPAGGADGMVNDVKIFQTDPMPKPGVPGTQAPVGSGGDPLTGYYFDMDGVDRLNTSLRTIYQGNIIPYFPDNSIHTPDYVYVSFDDDTAPNYTSTQGSVPVNSLSPFTSQTFGTTSGKDEIQEFDFAIPSPINLPPYTPTNTGAVTDEKDLHPQLASNPDNGQTADDDVDALDIVFESQAPVFTYFSADHEALYHEPYNQNLLNPSSIYESLGTGFGAYQFMAVIMAPNLGIFPETDIDAFEFVWLWNNEIQNLALALLFSVDDDDPLTPLNESGLLNPAMIYYSFLNGMSFPFLDEPLSEDIDAITVSEESYLATIIPAGWNITPTAVSHLIVIPASVIPVKDNPVLAEGDLVGVFYKDESNNEKCGGYTIWSETNNMVVTAFGDDAFTPEMKEGFAESETFIWKVYIMNESTEYDALVTYDNQQPNYDGKFYDNGLSALTSLSIITTTEITIYEGWNGISSPVVPVDAGVETIFEPVYDELIILQSMLGVYWPDQNVNTIGNWNPDEGYKIKVSDDLLLPITGTRPDDYSVTLTEGWNILPVISQSDVLAASVLNVPELIIAKEIAGSRVYWPSQSIYTLITLETGKAYMVKVNSTVSLTFSAKGLNNGYKFPVNNELENCPWKTTLPTPGSHVIAISPQFAAQFTHNDLIGVFDAEGNNRGVARLGSSREALVVFADDPLTAEIDGMKSGEEMYFKVFCKETGEIFELQPIFNPDFPDFDGMFTIDGLSAMDFKTGFETAQWKRSLQIFPNPVKDLLNIRIQDEKNSEFQIRIMNMNGSIVFENMIENISDTKVDLSTNPDGCYLLMISDGLEIVTKKIILKK